MSSDADLDLQVKKTQQTLGKYVKKPALTDKLLRKPPFRFLHDIVTSVVTTTGIFKDAFTSNELKSENVQEKAVKIEFLKKLIFATKSLSGKEIKAQPSKIVAGLEPAKTNELLQAIAVAIEKKNSSETKLNKTGEKGTTRLTTQQPKSKIKKDEANQIKRNVEATGKTDKKRVDKDKRKRDKKEVLKVKSEVPETNNKLEEGVIETEKMEPVTPRPVDGENKIFENNNLSQTNNDLLTERTELSEPLIPNLKMKLADLPLKQDSDEKITGQFIEMVDDTNGAGTQNTQKYEDDQNKSDSNDKSQDVINNKTPQDAANIQQFNAEEEKPVPELRKKTGREKVKISDKEQSGGELSQPVKINDRPQTASLLRPPSVRPPSARPGAPRIRERRDIVPDDEVISNVKIKVIVEGVDETIEKDDNMVTVELEPLVTPNLLDSTPTPEILNQQAHGQLVEQILETQKELTDGDNKRHVQIEWEADALRNRESKQRDMKMLQTDIQTVAKSAMPLGQIINYLLEDCDNILRELKQWRDLNGALKGKITELRSKTEKEMEPLQSQYEKIQKELDNQHERNVVAKAICRRNQQKIDKILATIMK